MANLALGIDTGGTFTDGVIYDLAQNQIINKTKTITTRHDLYLAIDNCFNDLLKEMNSYSDINMVSLSTTLATNAIVEGQGAEVGLIMIGFKPFAELPTPYYISIDGGCNIKGKIKKEVDLKAARKGIESLKSRVDAFAISGYLSIRNPVQEQKVEELVREMTGYPVVSAHQLSSELGCQERTVTAVFNARLMPLITNLIQAVRENLTRRGIEAALMVVRGDGSLISEKVARRKPVETALSGPAASIVGAISLTNLEDGIVVDMGGTTTDVALIKKGRPFLTEKGAKVGGWLTRVKAAKITTGGIGGDSYIQVKKNGDLAIGPQRVFPLSWAVQKYPHLYDELREIEKNNFSPLAAQPTILFVYIKEPVNFEMSENEKNILNLLREKPHSLYHLASKLDTDPDILPWKHLVTAGSIHRASLTPTDILHVREEFNRWNNAAARLGTEIMARRYNCNLDNFAEEIMEEIYFKLAALITGVLVAEKGYRISLDDENIRFFLNEMLKNNLEAGETIQFSLRSNLPIIAVGAPVNAYFPQVAKRINTELFLPPSAEVANAVGTVSGKVVERVTVVIKPGDRGGFFVHHPEGRKGFRKLENAIDFGSEKGREIAYEQALNSGATDIEILVNQQDKYTDYPGQKIEKSNIEDKIFIESRLKITAVGRPW